MKPYLLKVPLQRKEPKLHFDVCQVDHIHRLSAEEFWYFKNHLLEDYDFLREYNEKYARVSEADVRPGVLVLGDGSDDGVFVCTEGADYARYSAIVPNARQWLLLKEYPALQDYGEHMTGLADKYIHQALNVGVPDAFHVPIPSLEGASMYYSFDEELFLDLLANRPEVERVNVENNEILLNIDPESLPQRNQPSRTISDEDFKIMCAKHLLWLYDAGGAQADFSNCVLVGADFSGLELNSALFDGTMFRRCDFSSAALCFASFQNCRFVGCNGFDLTAEEATFQGAVFSNCDFRGAIMTHSDFTRAILQDSNLERASLQNCLLEGTQFEGTRLDTTNFSGATEDAAAWYGEVDPNFSMEEIQ